MNFIIFTVSTVFLLTINLQVKANNFNAKDYPMLPARSPPKSGSSQSSCHMDARDFLDSSKKDSKKGIGALPGYQKNGQYCTKEKDVGCLSECLKVLGRRFLSAYCVPSNSTCICRQTQNSKDYEQRLAQQGLLKPPAGCCKQVGPKEANAIRDIQNQHDPQPVPPSRSPGVFCKGSADVGCMSKCLSILQKLFKSATCDPSNSNCVCRQDKNPSNFEKNLKDMGVDAKDPRCKGQGAGGSGGHAPPFIPFAPPVPLDPKLTSPHGGGGPDIIVEEGQGSTDAPAIPAATKPPSPAETQPPNPPTETQPPPVSQPAPPHPTHKPASGEHPHHGSGEKPKSGEHPHHGPPKSAEHTEPKSGPGGGGGSGEQAGNGGKLSEGASKNGGGGAGSLGGLGGIGGVAGVVGLVGLAQTPSTAKPPKQ